MARPFVHTFDDSGDEDDDFVALLPPPVEKYDSEWRGKLPEYPSRCPHCKNWIGNQNSEEQQVQHILNGCRTFENQGRYRWRHQALLYFIDSLMDRKNLRIYSDLPDHRTESEGTVPEQLLGPRINLVQGLKPDMVFFSRSFDDESTFTVGVLEISIPWDGRVEPARAEKQQKNAVLVEALSAQTRTPVRFLSLEIGSFRQRLSEGTKASIKELHSFTNQSLSCKAFRSRIVKLAELASFQLYASRFDQDWPQFSPLLELPPEILEDDKDNVSSESEPLSLGATTTDTDSFEESKPESTVENVGSEVSEIKPDPVSVASTEVVAFEFRTKLCIYGSAAGAIAYVLYNYWHVILMGLFCFLIYKIWDKYGHFCYRKTKKF